MSIAKTSKKELKDCESVKIWANSIPIMRLLKKDDDMYLNELFLLSLIFRLTQDLGRPITKTEVIDNFNVLSYNRDKMMNKLLSRGLIKNDMEGPRKAGNVFKLIVSPLGEQLLIKYERAMRRLCEGEK